MDVLEVDYALTYPIDQVGMSIRVLFAFNHGDVKNIQYITYFRRQKVKNCFHHYSEDISLNLSKFILNRV